MNDQDDAKVAVLDDYPNVSQIYFSQLSGLKIDYFPETLNPATDEGFEALVERLEPYKIVSTMRERTPFPAALLDRLPNLKLLLTTGMRNKALDIAHATEKGIVVTGTNGRAVEGFQTPEHVPQPSVGLELVAQHHWAILLALCSRVPADDYALKSNPNAWQSGFAFVLAGKTLGLLGLGRLGTHAARIGHLAFDMNIITWSENMTQEKADAAAGGCGFPKGTFKTVTKEEPFRQADIVSVNVVLSPRTTGIVGTEELGLMKKSALLVNISRGPLIDESALLDVLERGAIRGFATDVFSPEPLPPDSPWRSVNWGRDGRSDVVLSPHMGYADEAKQHRWYQEQADIVSRWVKGEEVPSVLR